jgi:hypothetical protein
MPLEGCRVGDQALPSMQLVPESCGAFCNSFLQQRARKPVSGLKIQPPSSAAAAAALKGQNAVSSFFFLLWSGLGRIK